MDKRIAVITGGAHGIGKAISDAFKNRGDKVYIIDKELGDWFVGDISCKETLEAFAQCVIKEAGHIDYLISNALPLMKGIDAGFINGENICIDGGMTKLMIYHGEHGWNYSKGE